jgi:hypothetical protein
MSQNLEIMPVNGNHVVYQGGQAICRFDTIKQAEAFVLSELLGDLAPVIARKNSGAAGFAGLCWLSDALAP